MASAYIYIYLIVLGLIILWQCAKPMQLSPFNPQRQPVRQNGAFWLMIICILFIGFRPVDITFADMVGYNENFKLCVGKKFTFDFDAENLIFDNIMPFLASIGCSASVYFTLIATIYFGAMYIACKKLFPNNLLVAYLACLTAFSTFSYGTNGIKAGAAASIFLVALAYKDKLWLTILLSLVSWGFHHSMSMVLVAYFCSRFFKGTKWYFWGWLVALIIAILNITYFQLLFAQYSDEKGVHYLITNEYSYLTGFRPDFVLYSVAPIVIGFYMIFIRRIKDAGYELWLRMYLLTNAVWMLCMYASFSNRIAYLSWFLYPVVLIYPYLKIIWHKRQGSFAKQVVIYQYLFTLFMEVIYYTILKQAA